MSADVHGGLHSSSLPILLTLVLTALAVVYLRGWYQLRSAQPDQVSVAKLVAFIAGVVSLWAAIASPLAGLDHQLLTAHMVQHLLLMTVAAPLILLGAPGVALSHGIPRRVTREISRLLRRCPAVPSVGSVLGHPVFCWLASTMVVIGWHVPAVFALGMQSSWWHNVEQASFFAAGLLFWWPVIQPRPSLERWPRWHTPVYLFLATLPCDALSGFLVFCNRVVYSHYAAAGYRFGLSPLADQGCAGALMWIWVTFAYLIPAAVITIELLSPRTIAPEVQANIAQPAFTCGLDSIELSSNSSSRPERTV
jgi:putative membrane protein